MLAISHFVKSCKTVRCRSWDGHWRLTFCDSFPIQKPEKKCDAAATRNAGVCDTNKFTWEGCGNTTGWLGIWILSIISNAESSTIEIIINCSFRQTNGFFYAARFAVKHLPKAPWKKTAEKQSALGELHGISAPTKEFLLILDICKALSHMWGSGHLRGLLKRVVCWDGLPGKYLHLWSSCEYCAITCLYTCVFAIPKWICIRSHQIPISGKRYNYIYINHSTSTFRTHTLPCVRKWDMIVTASWHAPP